MKRSESSSARYVISTAACIVLLLFGINAQAQAPPQVMSPVQGKVAIQTPNSEPPNESWRWVFNQHQDGITHGPCKIGCADDTYAFDCNLYNPIYDFDNQRLVFPVADGRVVAWAGYNTNPQNPNEVGIKGPYGAVLIEHVGQYGQLWYSGYLHMSPIYVEVGYQVTTTTPIGRVSSVGAGNSHLHIAIYEGDNYGWTNGLRSKQYVSFIDRDDHVNDWPGYMATNLGNLGSIPTYNNCFIDYPNDHDLFVVTVAANSHYIIKTTVSNGMDTVMTLYDQYGNWIMENDDADNSLASKLDFYTYGYSGQYYFRVRHYHSSETGRYGLTMQKLAN